MCIGNDLIIAARVSYTTDVSAAVNQNEHSLIILIIIIIVNIWSMLEILSLLHVFPLQYVWLVTCLLLSIFPLLPVVGRKSNYSIV